MDIHNGKMHTYIYDGPVTVYERLVCNSWHGQTVAVSEKKAKSNLAYQYKGYANLVAGAGHVDFPGRLIQID